MMHTDNKESGTTLKRWAEERGFQVGWGPRKVVDETLAEIGQRLGAGEIDASFARDSLAFPFKSELSSARDMRLVIVAVPRPAHVVSFVIAGRRSEALLPPTYEHYRPLFEDVRQDLSRRALAGAKVQTIDAPLKGAAARLGMIRYGRNNLAYSPRFGSYMQLLGYLTDAPLPVQPEWQARVPLLLEECEFCGMCESACPTGAIDPERVLLHAERCLTFANEAPGPWPEWVPAAAHRNLIGCLACQQVCPANAQLPVQSSGVTFSEEETQALLADVPHEAPAWDGIRAKLERLGQPHQESVISRNLRAFLSAQGFEPGHLR